MDNLYNIGQPQFFGSRKRKRSSTYSSEDEDAVAPYVYPAPTSPLKTQSPSADEDSETDHKNKRARRTLNIERGMGGMSLNGQNGQARFLPASIADPTKHHLPTRSSLDYLNAHNVSEPEHLEIDEDFGFRDDHLDGGDDLEVVTPNVEEADSPGVRISKAVSHQLNDHQYDDNDIDMRTASWYEPEKDRESHSVDRIERNETQTPIIPSRVGIVITDLSDSETEQQDGDNSQYSHESHPQFIISPTYLQRVSIVPKLPFPSAEPDNSMALVAYRPVPYLPVQVSEPDEVQESNSAKVVDRICTGDAMDIDD
jgi:hypothetical protein